MDKEAFFASDAVRRKTSTYRVDGFGEIDIQALSLPERLLLPKKLAEDDGAGLTWVVIWGVPEFDAEDYDRVAGMAPNILDKLAAAILRLSDLDVDAGDRAKKN